MKPAYWIGILALLGALIGYFFYRSTGWFGSGIGAVIGILLGTLIYSIQKNKKK